MISTMLSTINYFYLIKKKHVHIFCDGLLIIVVLSVNEKYIGLVNMINVCTCRSKPEKKWR